MKKPLLLAALLLQSCASANTTYIGNGLYEIDSSGAPAAGDAKVRRLLFEEAFKTCAKEGKGFVIMGMEDTSTTSYHASAETNGYGTAQGYRGYAQAQYRTQGTASAYSMRHPGNRAVIRCDGPVDPRLQEQFGEREPASK